MAGTSVVLWRQQIPWFIYSPSGRMLLICSVYGAGSCVKLVLHLLPRLRSVSGGSFFLPMMAAE